MATDPESRLEASPGSAQEAAPAEASSLELAIPVSERVQLLAITLAECSVTRNRTVNLSKQDLEVIVDIGGVTVAVDRDHDVLLITQGFELLGTKPIIASEELTTSATDREVLVITASFELEYRAERLREFSEEALLAFAQTNGVFNAWPYWREFVQSTTARMGTKPIVVPLFRL